MLHGGVKQEQEEEEEEEEEEEVRVENSLSLGVHVRPDGPRWSPRAGAFLCTHTGKKSPPAESVLPEQQNRLSPGSDSHTALCGGSSAVCCYSTRSFFPFKTPQ